MRDEVYVKVAEAIEQGPFMAPRSGDGFSDAFIKHLKLLYKPEAAEVVQHLKVIKEFYASGSPDGSVRNKIRALHIIKRNSGVLDNEEPHVIIDAAVNVSRWTPVTSIKKSKGKTNLNKYKG